MKKSTKYKIWDWVFWMVGWCILISITPLNTLGQVVLFLIGFMCSHISGMYIMKSRYSEERNE